MSRHFFSLPNRRNVFEQQLRVPMFNFLVASDFWVEAPSIVPFKNKGWSKCSRKLSCPFLEVSRTTTLEDSTVIDSSWGGSAWTTQAKRRNPTKTKLIPHWDDKERVMFTWLFRRNPFALWAGCSMSKTQTKKWIVRNAKL